MSIEQRVWEQPIPNEVYVIGGDVAEGVERGDDSVLEGIKMSTGEQVFEVQGKIDPLTFGEISYQYGTWYNNALLGIENNKDGGANGMLHKLGYSNVYFQKNNTGEAFDKQTAKLGFNTNLKTRHEIIANGRKFMEDGSVTVRSQHLLSQFEIFALNSAGTKFEALSGGHDDLVMAWLIACEMFRTQLLIEESKDTVLLPYIDGEPFDPDLSEESLTREERIIERALKQQVVGESIASTVGSLV
tara:strand:+ start:172 stop:903 length:732 start_codon:yes stop_codon:yes gene_type:complete